MYGPAMRVVASILPKDVVLNVQATPGNLEPEAWATLRRAGSDEGCKVEGDPHAVFAAIEEDLRARLAAPVAKQIDG